METLLIEDAAGVRTLTLNRPDAMNAVDERMTRDLQDALKQSERDRAVRCLVLATRAPARRSASADLKSAFSSARLAEP
ncbi:MAG: enoyl-CoA hydratase-related protein [Phycisphaerae bacterium]